MRLRVAWVHTSTFHSYFPILGDKAKYVRENAAVGTSYTPLAIFRGFCTPGTASTRSILRFCTTTSDTTAYAFGLALSRGSRYCCCRGYCLSCFKYLEVLYHGYFEYYYIPGSLLLIAVFCLLVAFVLLLLRVLAVNPEIPSICPVYFQYDVYFDRLCTVSTNSQAHCSAQNTPR